MRKILTGVLSVAGLLAVVLALASGPATAQMVVAFQTDSEPGAYAVSWDTQGGCDPSKPNADTTLATDGASGTISRSVSNPTGTPKTAAIGDADVELGEDDNNQGRPVEFSVAIAAHCTYNWSGTFTSSLPNSSGISCAVGVGDTRTDAVSAASRDGVLEISEDPADVVDGLRLGVDDEACNSVAKINVDIPRPTDTVGGEEVPDQPHSGAILNTTFTVTATPVDDSNDECAAVTEETEVDDKDTNETDEDTNDDTVGAILTVIQQPLSDETPGAECDYDVSVDVAPGFDTTVKNSNIAKVRNYVLTAVTKFAADGPDVDTEPESAPVSTADCRDEVTSDLGQDTIFGTDDDVETVVEGDPCVDLELAVAVRDIYILQNVDGDAAGGTGQYTLSADSSCGIPGDLPPGLAQTTSGGIQVTVGTTVVELRKGFYNITGAVLSPVVTTPEFDPAKRYALNDEADECVMSAEVDDIPDICTVDTNPVEANMVTGVDDKGRAIMRFDLTCEADTSDDTSDADMGDMGDDDTSDDDMGDMGDDDTSDDDMGDMGDDDDAMGPPEDVATG